MSKGQVRLPHLGYGLLNLGLGPRAIGSINKCCAAVNISHNFLVNHKGQGSALLGCVSFPLQIISNSVYSFQGTRISQASKSFVSQRAGCAAASQMRPEVEGLVRCIA